MDITTLRQFWELIDGTQAHTLLRLNDNDLVYMLIRQMEEVRPLNPEETGCVVDYIRSRTPLIRDIALTRAV